MALKLTLIAFAALVHQVQGHMSFVRIAHNGVWQEPLRYIRNKTAPFEERVPDQDTNKNTRVYNGPTYSTDLENSVRCGRDNMAYAANTEVLTVRTGDTIEMAHQNFDPYQWDDSHWNNCPEGRGSCDPKRPGSAMVVFHIGPVVVHLSKVPDGQDVREYDGSGEWVKIWTAGLDLIPDAERPVRWLPNNNDGVPGRFIFKIPAQTPAGQYLLRADQVYPMPSRYISQQYPGCAQILVESELSGELPSGGINIPEGFSRGSPGMTMSTDMTLRKSVDPDFVYPGGPLWDGEKLIEDKPVV